MEDEEHTVPYVPPELVGDISSFLPTKMRRVMRVVSSAWNRGVVSRHAFCDPFCVSFYQYAGRGTLNVLKFLYKNGADIHATTSGLLLYIACSDGQLATAKWLSGRGVSVRSQEVDLFLNACASGHLEMAQWLVEQGADIHAQDDKAFISACVNGHLEVAKWLQEQGADIRAQGGRAFISASQYGHLEVVKWLEEQGADIHAWL